MHESRRIPSASLLLAVAALTASLAAQDALLGTWRSVGPDQEVLEFRADGSVRIDGALLRYRATPGELSIQTPDGSLRGTWSVVEPELSITLHLSGDERTGRYRRTGGGVPRRQPTGDQAERPAGTRTTIAGLTFELPKGWSIARRDGDNLLINPGFTADDTLDALICVLSGTLEPGDGRRAIRDLLRSRLPLVSAELAGQQIEADFSRADIAASGAFATLEVPGMAGGDKSVRVWLGATRDDTRYAAVLAVVLDGKRDRFLPGAKHVLRSLAFTAGDAAASATLAGAEFSGSLNGQGADALHTIYTFDGQGGVRRRTMFSSPMGGMDSTRGGSYELRGDVLVMEFADGKVEAKLETEQGEVVALRIGRGRYARQ